ncbi:MAG: amidase [Myxococcales bacterium]|nr:amidase [Myxococcales bacterium]
MPPPTYLPSPDSLLTVPAWRLVELLRRRDVSSVELTTQALTRIEAVNPHLSAFVTLTRRAALRAAEKVDRHWRRTDPRQRGYYAGIPTAVKDLNFMRGAPAQMGTPIFRYLWSPVDDVTVAALRLGGFVFVGKTATSELGIMPVTETDNHPPTRNPFDSSRSAGGSSGGAGAAVASGCLPIAHASDGAGSIRIPASFCGLVGMKASAFLAPNPHRALDTMEMSMNGAVTRDVRDTAGILDLLVKQWPDEPHAYTRRSERPVPRSLVRIFRTPPLGALDARVGAVFDRAVSLLGGLGFSLEEGSFAGGIAGLDDFLPIYQNLAAKLPIPTPGRLQPITRWLRDVGKTLPRGAAETASAKIVALAEVAFAGSEFQITPTVPVIAPDIGAFGGEDGEEAFRRAAVLGAYTAAANLTGRPAITLPAGTVDGMPVGVQVMARRGDDAALLSLAREFEAALKASQ